MINLEPRARGAVAPVTEQAQQAMASESRRIAYLIARDGVRATRRWVERTRRLYCDALASGASHASIPEYRPLFEEAVREFDEWLAAQELDEGVRMREQDFDKIASEELAQRRSRETPDNEDRSSGYALVNVLKPEAFAGEHLPGSINIPQGEEEHFESRFDEDKEIIVCCASFDCQASPSVARELTRRGFTAVRDYEGGVKDWEAGGKPIER